MRPVRILPILVAHDVDDFNAAYILSIPLSFCHYVILVVPFFWLFHSFILLRLRDPSAGPYIQTYLLAQAWRDLVRVQFLYVTGL